MSEFGSDGDDVIVDDDNDDDDDECTKSKEGNG